ncbi:MAG: TatD DNase family protein [Candidatus Nanohaloarchaea archaeon]|jgi:TatD DNase family protein
MSHKPVDAHCHLDFDKFDDDREEVIQKCQEKLDFIVNSGREPESNQDSLNLQEEHPDFVYATAGIHPTHTDSFDKLKEVKRQVEENNFHAVGEIGMDFHHVEEEELREKQHEVFVEMVELAEEQDLPVVVHSRNAEKQVIDILEEKEADAYLHCFNGNISQLERALDEDMFIGVTYQVLYSNRVQELAENIPLENLLLETDSPFLKKGERNTPLTVREVAGKIADIKELDQSKVVERTTMNAEDFFNID